MPETKVKPCPFCGGHAEVARASRRVRVYCTSLVCPVTSMAVDSYGDDSAIERWNTRASDSRLALAEEVIADLCQHDGAEGFSVSTYALLDRWEKET